MDETEKKCNHIVGWCHNKSYGGGGVPAPLKMSHIKEALEGAREFYAQSIDAEVQHLPEAEADKIFDDRMAEFDSKPILWRLKQNAVLYTYCPICGADLKPTLARIGGDA